MTQAEASIDSASLPASPVAPDLGRSAARGALAMVVGQIARVAIQLGGVLILARLLSPQDYGAFAMVTAVVSLGELLQDFGLSSAAIQAPRITRAQQSNLFWINTSIGVLSSLAVFAGAPLLAAFYARPELTAITRALAPVFLLSGLGCQLRAQLTRDLRMDALSKAAVGAQAAGLAAGLIGALRGLGAWALVAQQITYNVVQLAVIANAARFRPSLPARNAGTRSFLRFGGNVMLITLVTHISRNANTVLIGSRLGAELAGLYDRAFMLLMMPLNQINVPLNSVALPTLSKLQHDSTRFDRFLLHGQTVLCHIVFPVFTYSIAVGDPLIALVMGPKWHEAAPLFRILCFAGMFQTAAGTIYWAFTAKGHAYENLRMSLVTRGGMVLLLLAASAWGVLGMTIAYSLGMALTWPIGLIWLSRTMKAPIRELTTSVLRCVCAYGACAGAAWFAARMLSENSLYLQVAVSALAMPAVMLGMYTTWPAYRTDLLAILNTRKLLRATKAS